MAQAEVVAELNRETGSPESRRLRREGKVPAVIYGREYASTPVACNARDLRHAFSNRVVKGALVTLVIEGKKQLVQVQDVQKHPVRREVSHVDFVAMTAGEIITASVNMEAEAGVELLTPAVEVSGKASAIPASISITADLANEEGDILASSLPLAKQMTLITDGHAIVARLEIQD